jgi:hypothetical protein
MIFVSTVAVLIAVLASLRAATMLDDALRLSIRLQARSWGKTTSVFACRVFGHRYRFRAEGPQLVWTCERGCGDAGQKDYPTSAQAQRYAAAFDKRDSDVGARGPMLGLLPLRVWRWLRHRGETTGDRDAHRA